MAHSLKCQVCSKTATVHLTQIINNKVHKVDLCDTCAHAKGVTDPAGFSLADLLVKPAVASDAAAGTLVCESCGFTQTNFKKAGRLGCPACWTRFREQLDPLLATMHRGTAHAGKLPHLSIARLAARGQMESLLNELKAAIAAERYEDAARLRDDLRKLREAAPAVEADDAT